MSLTGTTPSELIFKNVLRTVNGLPPTNTDYLHEFPTDNFVNSSNMASMVKVITKDEMIYNLEGMDFFAENPDFDLDHIELVCFSNYAIELLKGAISDNNSPLWKIDCNFKDIKLEHTESISKINGSFMNTSNTDMEGSLANIDALRGLLRDYLDEATLAFLSEIFPVANGVAFPMWKKSQNREETIDKVSLKLLPGHEFLKAQKYNDMEDDKLENCENYTKFSNLFKYISPRLDYSNICGIDDMIYEYVKRASKFSTLDIEPIESFLDKADDYMDMTEFDLGECSLAKRNAIRFLIYMARNPYHPASSKGWCQLTPFTLMLLYIFNLQCSQDIDSSIDKSFSCLSVTKKFKTPLSMAIDQRGNYQKDHTWRAQVKSADNCENFDISELDNNNGFAKVEKYVDLLNSKNIWNMIEKDEELPVPGSKSAVPASAEKLSQDLTKSTAVKSNSALAAAKPAAAVKSNSALAAAKPASAAAKSKARAIADVNLIQLQKDDLLKKGGGGTEKEVKQLLLSINEKGPDDNIEKIRKIINQINSNNMNPNMTGYYDPDLFLNKVLLYFDLESNEQRYWYNHINKIAGPNPGNTNKFNLFKNYKLAIKTQKEQDKAAQESLHDNLHWAKPQPTKDADDALLYVGGDSFFSRYSKCIPVRSMISMLFSSMLTHICHKPKYENVINNDDELDFKSIKSTGFLIKMLKSNYSHFVFEFFPHSIDFICHQKKLQKLLVSAYNIYIVSGNISMTDDIINSNILQYVNILRRLLPAETLGYTDVNDHTRRESEISTNSGNNNYFKTLLDNKIRRRGGNFIYRKQPVSVTNIMLFTNSSVFLRLDDTEDINLDNIKQKLQSKKNDYIMTQHFIKQKCSDAYRMITNGGFSETKILTPFDSATEPPLSTNNINITGSLPKSVSNPIVTPSIGGTKSKEELKKKMKVLAKRYQARDKCSWENALKKAGKKLACN